MPGSKQSGKGPAVNRFVPITDQRSGKRVPSTAGVPEKAPRDRLGRHLRDLRISVTDRCNFRCVYCMPKEIFDKDYRFLPQSSLLSFEEITRAAKILGARGVEKTPRAGGEPLLRKHLERLVEMLRKLRTPDGRPLD